MKYVFVNSQGGVVQSITADDDIEVVELDWDEVKQSDDPDHAIEYGLNVIRALNRIPLSSDAYNVAQEAIEGVKQRIKEHMEEL